MEGSARYRALQRTSVITIWVNIVLAVLKVLAGMLSGSTAVLSDGIHTLSDVVTTAVVLVGLRFSNQDADREHPYGHQRVESLISLFLGFMLALTALYLGWRGVRMLRNYQPIAPSLAALAVTLGSIASKEWMYQYTKRVAEKYNSTALLSDAWHHRSDAVSSIAVLVGVVGVFFGAWMLEPVATIVVCLIILKAAWEIVASAANQLIDRSAGAEVYHRIKDLALSVDGVEGVDSLRTRLSNNIVFADIEVVVDARLSVAQGHAIAEEVHDLVEGCGLSMGHCMVHVHPTSSGGEGKAEG